MNAVTSQDDVLVTGVGIVCPLGAGVENFWTGLLAGRSRVGRITSFPCDDLPSRIAGEVSDDLVDRWVDPAVAGRLDRFGRMAAAAAALSLEDAGIDGAAGDGSNRALILGSAVAGLQFSVEQYEHYLARGVETISPYLGMLQFGGACVREIGEWLGCRGPNLLISSSSMDAGAAAVRQGVEAVRNGRADVVLAGGADATVFPLSLAALGLTGILSERNEEPERACRPFDRLRDGMVLGEGACVLVLESREHLRARGGRAYARIRSCASVPVHSDRRDRSERMAEAMGRAMEECRWSAEDLDYVVMQGMSTIEGDRDEARALGRILGGELRAVPASAPQSMTGHLQGAAGPAGIAAAALAIREGRIPPTANHDEPDPECVLDCVAGRSRTRTVRRCLSHCYGLGGSLSATALDAVEEEGIRRMPEGAC